jgi:hypothetical protein
MQAQAAEFSGYTGEPPPLFELRRARKARKGRVKPKRRPIPLLIGEEILKSFRALGSPQ